MSGREESKKVIVQRGLWFEEFETDVLYQHRPGRTITEADNVLFTTLTMNTQALHLDAAFSDALPPFNQRLVNSMFTLSTLVGLSVAQLTQGTIVGNLGFGEVAFPKPLFHGDTLYAETEITEKRESKSRPGRASSPSPTSAAISTATSWRPRPARPWCASGPREQPDVVGQQRAGLAVLSGRSTRTIREGSRRSRCRDPRPRGRGCRQGSRSRAPGADRHPLDPARTVVRINPSATPDHQLDLDALARTDYTVVMLAKTESPARSAIWRRVRWLC